MHPTDQREQVIEEQYDQILRLRRRLVVAQCVAALSIALLVGVSFLQGLSRLSGDDASVAAQQEAIQQRKIEDYARQVAIQETVRANQAEKMAQQSAMEAKRQADMARQALIEAGRSAARTDEPVAAPVS